VRKINSPALIIALLKPDTGKVTFDDLEVTETSAQQVRRRVGYVIQEGGLFPHLTARANVLLLSRHLGRPASQMEERLEELCALSRFPRMDSIAIRPSFPGDNASASA
jgi:osmoprotectant transport system ATP-binding protein